MPINAASESINAALLRAEAFLGAENMLICYRPSSGSLPLRACNNNSRKRANFEAVTQNWQKIIF
ncbi:hypothetical protein ACFOWX_06015 [Sphingorhabdus arenilitoris]|uniref:Uncharacterized protein n=1 Tax=Sphingorhabdus arenilitoris TaxID=1490041 RepID=A0ABV8RG89_9SPHN